MRFSCAILLSETVFDSDNLIFHALKTIACLKKEPFLKALVTKPNRSSYVQVTIITVKSQVHEMYSHTYSQHVKVLDFAPFHGSYEGIRVITK